MQLRITEAIMVAVCTLAVSVGQARAADLTINTAQDFSALDGSASDDDAAADGCLTVNGNLTIETGGEINANDPVAPDNDSATAICINVTGNMVMTGGGAIFAENRTGEGSGGAITIDVGGNFTMEVSTISSSKLTGASVGSAGAITIDVVGDINLGVGSDILGTSSSTTGNGATIDIDADGSITLHGDSPDGADIIADQIAGSCNGGGAGSIDLNAGVDVIQEDGSRITVDARCSAGAIVIVAARNVDIGGLVQSDSQLSGTGATQAPGGGPITIIAGVDLTVTDTGVIRSQGRDPGADLVHLEGCTVLVYGLVESTGVGHGTPNNPPNHLNSDNRPDKPSNSTAGVEIWAGTLLVIDSTGTHNGEVDADIGGPGGSSGTSWIDLIADGDIQIIGDTTGPFAVHANGITATTDNGGDITVKSVDGSITASGLALQASAPFNGGSGGNIQVYAKEDVTLDTATLEATGETRGGHIGDEGAGIKSFQGTVSWTNGVGDVRATGTDVVDPANRGTIVFQDCTVGDVDTTGTSFPVTGGTATTPTTLVGFCGGAPSIESYVILPDCETVCGDGNIDPGEECESPFEECCDPATCLFLDGTLCRIGSGDGCDPSEVCSGTSQDCPDDTVASQGTLCRTGTGQCDPDEECTGVAGEPCPGDAFLPSSTLCRASSGICDPPENCTGASGECPGDTLLPSSTLCRQSSGVCDPPENCTGIGGECPGNVFLPSNTLCRASSGVCDPQENCTGSTGLCPGNVFLPSNTLCRASSGVCDPQENCTGNSGTCPGNTFLPDDTVCRAAAGTCDVAEECTGSTGPCPGNGFVPTGTPCRTAGGVCDVPDVCSGTSAACVASAFLPSTTLCRSSSGICDPAENCSGTSGTCPTNTFLPSTTTCRTAVGTCGESEECTGSTGNCPADLNAAEGTPCISDDNACTADLCSTGGSCDHVDISDECSDNSSCTVDTCEPDIGCVYDDQCSAICRSPGYWATHSGFEQKKGKATINVAQVLLDIVGPLEVCGETISTTSNPSSLYLEGLGLTSDLEGLCMRAEGVAQRRLYRQLVAAALNCAASGFANDCDEVVGQFVDVDGVDNAFSECSAVCAGNPPPGAPSIGECVGWMDCFNNGGQVDGDGKCAFGTCETQTTVECDGDAGDCPNDEDCIPFVANCHEAAMCNEDLDFCPKSTPASSTAACREARFNECTIDSCP